ncbi:hypothetical protein GIB67_000761 [Kingdonia uniflora]|uniref:Uncharacterized protein n=1 Tax=Kingdonia uniflora TaxID=39325 RepID=A0A7J7NDF1_9MAGN|nr:hypothetical protein GIB67_000761 [Kingdonia uniflora]
MEKGNDEGDEDDDRDSSDAESVDERSVIALEAMSASARELLEYLSKHPMAASSLTSQDMTQTPQVVSATTILTNDAKENRFGGVNNFSTNKQNWKDTELGQIGGIKLRETTVGELTDPALYANVLGIAQIAGRGAHEKLKAEAMARRTLQIKGSVMVSVEVDVADVHLEMKNDELSRKSKLRENCRSDGLFDVPFAEEEKQTGGSYVLSSSESKRLKCGVLIRQSSPCSRDISLNGAMTANLGVSYDCYDKFGASTNNVAWGITLSSPFTFSDTQNKLTAIGCDTYAVMSDSFVVIFESGCTSDCVNEDNVVEGSCSGIGCCKTAIPKNLITLNINNDISFPAVLDWVVELETCEEAKRNLISYVCEDNSGYVESTNGPGYNCYCNPGYEGIPYFANGCQDIDECSAP